MTKAPTPPITSRQTRTTPARTRRVRHDNGAGGWGAGGTGARGPPARSCARCVRSHGGGFTAALRNRFVAGTRDGLEIIRKLLESPTWEGASAFARHSAGDGGCSRVLPVGQGGEALWRIRSHVKIAVNFK